MRLGRGTQNLRLGMVLALVAAVSAFGVASTAVALQRNEVLYPFHPVTDSQAIRYLNHQRVANGIASISENPELDRIATRQVSSGTEPARGQAPCPPPPSYYECIYAEGIRSWSPTVNPQLLDPEALAGIFDPALTAAGYVQHGGGGALLAGAAIPGNERWTTPTFFSLPGNGATALPWEQAEGNPAPQATVGIRPYAVTGPNMVVWLEGDYDDSGLNSAHVQAVLLSGPSGMVDVRIVSPRLWDPQDQPDPYEGTILVPLRRLLPNSGYTLSVSWKDTKGAAYQDVVHFKTSSAYTAEHPFDCRTCLHGYLRFSARGQVIHVSTAPAVGQRVFVRLGVAQRICTLNEYPCPRNAVHYIFNHVFMHVIPHYRHPVTFALPHQSTNDPVLGINVNESHFSADGYQYTPFTLTGPVGVP
jgi:hypothetical protein